MRLRSLPRPLRRLLAIILAASFLFQPLTVVFAQTAEQGATTTQPSEASTPPADPQSGTLPDQASPTATDAVTKDTGKPDDTGKPGDGDGDGTVSILSSSDQNGIFSPSMESRSARIQIFPDEFTGALRYMYRIDVPPGRNKLQPDLNLVYSSQSDDSGNLFGYGWSTNIPYISRINHLGSEKLYSENYFYSSLDGELATTSVANHFAAKKENGTFLDYTFTGNVWTAVDKNGTTYKFGSTTDARQDNSGNSNQVFKWMLEEVRDTNNNFIKYEYYKNAGQIYPSKIIYTGNGSTNGIFEIEFVRESRTDAVTSKSAGFTVTTSYRIKEIQAKVNGTWVKKYALAFGAGDNGERSLLRSITESGQGEDATTITLPADSFDYQSDTNQTGWLGSGESPLAFADSSGRDTGARLVDINGDALVDIVIGAVQTYESGTSDVYLNNGDGTWSLNSSWAVPVPTAVTYSGGGLYGVDAGTRFADFNGDGLTDVIQGVTRETSTTTIDTRKAYLNTGSGWTVSTTWTPSVSFVFKNSLGTFFDAGAMAADINGDGLTDIIKESGLSCSCGSNGNYLNNGNGWTYTNSTPLHPSGFTDSSGRDLGVRFAEINGDGLIDMVKGQSTSYDTGTSDVYINTGANDWDLDSSWSVPVPTSIWDSGSGWRGFDTGVRFADVNGDGLTDVIQGVSRQTSTTTEYTRKAYLNTGRGWTLSSAWAPSFSFVLKDSVSFDNRRYDGGSRVADFNGDGIADVLKAGGLTWETATVNYASKSSKELLSRMTQSEGGKTSFTYKTTAQHKNGSTLLNPKTPFLIDTLLTKTIDG